MKYYIGQIWWGYSEFPGDFYREDYKSKTAGSQKLRPFLILKFNRDGTARVAYSSSKTNPKWCLNINHKKDKYHFNINDTYDLPVSNLIFKKMDLQNSDFNKAFKNFRKNALLRYSSDQYRGAYEKKLLNGEFDRLNKHSRKLNRRNQFSPERQKQLFNPAYTEERVRLLNRDTNNLVNVYLDKTMINNKSFIIPLITKELEKLDINIPVKETVFNEKDEWIIAKIPQEALKKHNKNFSEELRKVLEERAKNSIDLIEYQKYNHTTQCINPVTNKPASPDIDYQTKKAPMNLEFKDLETNNNPNNQVEIISIKKKQYLNNHAKKIKKNIDDKRPNLKNENKH